MIIKQVRVSQQAKDQLSRLKGKTGIKNWNVLCRWALCYSLSEKTIPTDIQIAHLCGTGFIKEFDDLIKLAVKEKRA